MISPILEKLSELSDFSGMEFYKVDVDEQEVRRRFILASSILEGASLLNSLFSKSPKKWGLRLCRHL